MIEIYDTCNIGLSGEPTGGITLKLSEITGRPDITVLIPISKEAAVQMIEGARKMMGGIETADLTDLRRETQHGPQGNAGSNSRVAPTQFPRR